MRRSCCYAPDILEMQQADLVMLFFLNLLLDMLVFVVVQICFFSCEQNGEEPRKYYGRFRPPMLQYYRTEHKIILW